MSRPIKSRAWDKDREEMFDVDVIDFVKEIVEGVGQYKNIIRLSFDEVILRRPTGLKDKNGIEIYEGDIVKVLHGEWWSQHLGSDEEKAMTHEQYLDSLTKQYEVVFAIDRFVGKRHIGYSPWETDENGYTYTRLTPDKHGYIEIIGNIYENGDLLK